MIYKYPFFSWLITSSTISPLTSKIIIYIPHQINFIVIRLIFYLTTYPNIMSYRAAMSVGGVVVT